jgi:hypothetical protein
MQDAGRGAAFALDSVEGLVASPRARVTGAGADLYHRAGPPASKAEEPADDA